MNARWAALLALVLGACEEGLSIEPARLPEGHLGSPFKQVLSFPNAEGPIIAVERSGELPDGLRLTFREEAQEARIEGTPRTPGSYHFTISARSASHHAQRKYTMTIAP